jgi:hypothetical protein
MDTLVWIGALVSLAGVGGLVWCALLVMRARRAGLPDAELRARLERLVALNLGALLVSAVGLMLVVVGILLG